MAIDRRRFVALGLGMLLPGTRPFAANAGARRLLSCCSNAHGEHYLALSDTAGQRLWHVLLPARGHDVAVDRRQRRVAVFARRPGAFVWIVDLLRGDVLHRLSAESGRHFYGHGVFTPDERYLLCSENAYESGNGVIGVYDASANFQRIGEIPSHGIGPHQVRLLSDGETLVVANGGIRTHPDLPRVKANLASMQPNLAYLRTSDGSLLRRLEPEAKWHQLSIRHIDVSVDDRVAVAMQFEGRQHLRPPLIAIQDGEQPMRMLSAPSSVQDKLKNYCGSVAFSEDGLRFAVSSPRGGVITLWSADGNYLGAHAQADACGISRTQDGENDFFVSDGGGNILRIAPGPMVSQRHAYPGLRWDNHLFALGPRA